VSAAVPRPGEAGAATETYRNFVGGGWVRSGSTASVPNLNPADTRDVVGHVPLSTAEEARQAAQAAADAYPAWRETPAPVRGDMVMKAARLLSDERQEVARLLTREEGKTVKDALGEIQRTINILEYTAAESRRPWGDTIPSELPRNFCYTMRVPLGVVVCITPWNFPVAIPFWKIAPALVAGNTVVFKPATLTPGTATAVVSIFERAGVPKGVLNMVLGSGGTVGDALVDCAATKAVSFTGSNAVGARIYAQGAARMIRVQCEMGGKNPVVVMRDADLDLAAAAAAQGAYGSTGQRCTATSRVIVEEAVADAFVERLRKHAEAIRVGAGLDEGIAMGPAVDAAQLETDLEYIEVGKAEGAELVCGGRRLEGGPHAHGYFLEPTVFDRARADMRIAQEEIFGPVLSVIRVRDFDEAVAAANSVRYGLAASVFTRDVSLAYRFTELIDVGIVHVNSGTPGGEAQLPFGGSKATGVGPREQGPGALEFFTEVKVVYVDYTGETRKSSIY
jgi:alpha-ketoglutaric semialdehyde dehydrogenase